MSDQDIRPFQEEDIDSDSEEKLHLSSAANHHSPTSIPPHFTVEPPASAAYSSYAKRQSSSSFQEPSPKRAAPNPATAEHHLFGFKRLPLPRPFPAASQPALRRTVSEPIYSAENSNAVRTLPSFSGFSNFTGPTVSPTRPESFKNGAAQGIYRTVSDPSPFTNHKVMGAPPARKLPRSPSCGESPNTKRLKRMKERLKEMKQWWNQVMSETEEDEEDIGAENCGSEDNISKQEECEAEREENPPQEEVWVEKKGECLILHLRCPCDNINQILLSGSNCYYKLASF